MAAVAIVPLGLAFGKFGMSPLGFFDGLRGD